MHELGPKGRVLLVDDDLNDVEMTLSTLEGHGLAGRIDVVQHGGLALDYLYRRGNFVNRTTADPMLVLLDNKMPKVSGLEVIAIMKGDDRLKRIPVVALTSSRETGDLKKFYEHGVNAYVVKPVDFAEFEKAIKELGVFWGFVNVPPPIR